MMSRRCGKTGLLNRSRTATVRVLGGVLLAIGLMAGWPDGTLRSAQAAGWPNLDRAQGAGWLELKRDQRRHREQLGPVGKGLSPEVATRLGVVERQEDLDRRALDRREAQWLDEARRRERLSGRTGPPQGPLLRLRIERADANERLRRELRRHTLGPRPAAEPPLAQPPFRLR